MSDDTKDKNADSVSDTGKTDIVKSEPTDSALTENKTSQDDLSQQAAQQDEALKQKLTHKVEPSSTDSSNNLFTAKPAPKLKAAKNRVRFRPIPIISVVLSIIALLAIAWATYNQYQLQQNFEKLQTDLTRQSSVQTELNQSSSQTARSSLQTANGNQQIINQQGLLIAQLRQALTATQQRVRVLSGRQKQDWLLAEAEYLVKLAQLKITLEKDKYTAIALLKTADQRILETADNSLLELRQMIAKDISDLQLVIAPDISGIASKLNAISLQIPQLTLIALEFEPIKNRKPIDKPSPDEFSWSNSYQNFLNDFVTITDHSQPVKPLMTADQRGNLNNNIQLALQQAQIALLRGEQGLFKMNLDNAFQWIGEFFQHNQTSQAILEILTQISATAISIQLPNELQAKQAIKAINQQRLYQWLENSPQQINENNTSPSTESNLNSSSNPNLEVNPSKITGDQL